MSQHEPTIIPFTGLEQRTAMFRSTTVQLGPDRVVDLPDPDSRYPYFTFAVVDAGQTTGSHLHDGYGMLLIVEGDYEVTGRNRGAGTLTMTEPRHWSGECVPGPRGAMEVCFFDNGHATIPFFENMDDPRVVALFDSAPEYKPFVLGRPCPPADPRAQVRIMDRAQDGRRCGAGSMYPCQLGPSGFGTKPSSDGARPFAKLIDFEPGLDVRPHAYDGWSAMAVIRGSLDLEGTSLAARTSILLPPNTQHSYRVPSGGAQVMQFFETQRGAIPRFREAGTDVFALAG